MLIRDPLIYLKAASDLENEARKLRRTAQTIQKTNEHHDLLRRQYDRLKLTDKPEEFAIKNRLSVETVQYWLKKKTEKAKFQALQDRNQDIVKLSRTGWTNKEIAKVYKLHHGSVNRIICEARKAQAQLFPKLPKAPSFDPVDDLPPQLKARNRLPIR